MRHIRKNRLTCTQNITHITPYKASDYIKICNLNKRRWKMTNDQHPKHNGGSKDQANHDHDDHDHHGHGDHKEKHTHGEHSHHDHHAMLVQDYKFRLWWVLALTDPNLPLAPMISDLLG